MLVKRLHQDDSSYPHGLRCPGSKTHALWDSRKIWQYAAYVPYVVDDILQHSRKVATHG